MTTPGCIKCSDESRRLRRAVKDNERHIRAGRPVDLTEIERAKQTIADCAARGHYDPAEVAARLRRQVPDTTSPTKERA